MKSIDLNCDLGEGCSFDRELLQLITSANVACGFHAGDPATAFRTLKDAAEFGVTVGAHPGFADREHFGRRELARSEQEIFEDCLYQIGALMGLAKAVGQQVRYVKPHGALYNMACRDDNYARSIVKAAALFNLPILGLPHSRIEAMSATHCRFVAEGFADRRYLPNGNLVPRTQPDAFVENIDEALRQVAWLMEQGVQTMCVHGDNPKAIEFVKSLRAALIQQGIEIRSFV